MKRSLILKLGFLLLVSVFVFTHEIGTRADSLPCEAWYAGCVECSGEPPAAGDCDEFCDEFSEWIVNECTYTGCPVGPPISSCNPLAECSGQWGSCLYPEDCCSGLGCQEGSCIFEG